MVQPAQVGVCLCCGCVLVLKNLNQWICVSFFCSSLWGLWKKTKQNRNSLKSRRMPFWKHASCALLVEPWAWELTAGFLVRCFPVGNHSGKRALQYRFIVFVFQTIISLDKILSEKFHRDQVLQVNPTGQIFSKMVITVMLRLVSVCDGSIVE